MNRFFRFYNQNKLEFWIMVLIIAFILVMLQVFNGWVKNDSKRIVSLTNENIEEEQRKETVSNNPIINGNKINDVNKKENVDTIELFLQYCKNKEIEKAYSLLSKESKESKYDSINIFEETYVKNRFSSNVKYSYELWDSSKENIYRIKIYENALASGKVSTNYKEDYFSVIYEDGQYKININDYEF